MCDAAEIDFIDRNIERRPNNRAHNLQSQRLDRLLDVDGKILVDFPEVRRRKLALRTEIKK